MHKSHDIRADDMVYRMILAYPCALLTVTITILFIEHSLLPLADCVRLCTCACELEDRAFYY